MTAGLQVLNGSPNVLDSVGFQSKYPALSLKIAADTAHKSGLDPSDPRNIVQTMQSDTYQKRVAAVQQGQEDPGKIQLPPAGPITKHFSQNVDPSSEISGGFQDKANALQAGIDRRAVLQGDIATESARLSKMVDFDKEAYTNQKLAELQPTQSIDKAIMDIRNRALVDKARFYSDPEITSLPFALQEKVIGERMGMYTDQLNELADLRQSRLEGAKAKIKSGLDAYDNRVESSKTRISALEKSIDYAKQDGADEQEIAQLRIDHAKEVERLQKARGKGDSQSTGEELVANAMIQRYQKTYGVLPEGADLTDIQRQAKLIVKQNKGLTDEVVAAGGQYARLPAGRSSVTTTEPNPNAAWYIPGDSTVQRTRTTDPFEDAGFGTPALSASGRKRLIDLK